ncbi:hypothetical protein FOA52_006743 [Chlamydomonas sp. UWO 241]|nr:hypothetical protein FOA52_006743 [Chlamydomonas sp. UWO 241]
MDEFRISIQSQKTTICHALPSLWRSCYAAALSEAPAAVASVSGKRSGGALAAQEPKRPAQLVRPEEFEIRRTGILKECQRLLKQKVLNRASLVKWFLKPVDPIAQQCPNYFVVVKNPMDLGTVRDNLTKGRYLTPLEFKHDVDLVWYNCMLYNLEGSEPNIAGNECKLVWERAWRDSGIEQQWAKMQNEFYPASQSQPPMQSVLLHELVASVNSDLMSAVQELPTSHGGGPGHDMTFADRRRLSIRLSRITSTDLMEEVLEVCAADPRATMAGGDVEVSLDELKASTLWRLQQLLDAPRSWPAAGAPASAAAARPSTSGADQYDGGGRAAPERGRGGGQQGGKQGKQAREAEAETAENAETADTPPDNSVQSGAGSDSEGGDNEVRGSSLEDPHYGGKHQYGGARGGGGGDGPGAVDQSATGPKEKSLFVKDKPSVRKADVNINAANWSSLAAAPSMADESGGAGGKDGGGGDKDHDGGGDDVWKSFQSIAEQKQAREEQQRAEAEAAERAKREGAERARREEEERKRALKEEEARAATAAVEAREAQMQKELAEIQAQQGTAKLTQDAKELMLAAQMPSMHAGSAGGLADLGLERVDDDDEDMNFEDD